MVITILNLEDSNIPIYLEDLNYEITIQAKSLYSVYYLLPDELQFSN